MEGSTAHWSIAHLVGSKVQEVPARLLLVSSGRVQAAAVAELRELLQQCRSERTAGAKSSSKHTATPIASPIPGVSPCLHLCNFTNSQPTR
jgi:hypothetical protein